MTLLKIASIGAPVLRQRAREVSPQELASPELQTFVDDLVETMHDASGAGLAAIQVHRAIRIVAIHVQDNPRYPYKPNIPLTILVNPVLTPLSEERFDNYEGCLSVPDLRGVVSRWAELRVQALDRHGAPIDTVVRGITAGTYQHEVDHLDGVLFVDRVTDPTTLTTWKEFARHHEAGFRERVEAVVKRWGS
ncbi:peptide deformylase [Paraliomyxa miuraensis]|uniref:peptide deformylase n=1 Tax=Paraliomyxa miuraensis TaxID=376150 RepID=UPI00225A1A94|nr:peptide deformylase [Paraliomyxa miuraensis]MCX4241898.1 peptide deformylase [Paraliomyxa miuraensis]